MAAWGGSVRRGSGYSNNGIMSDFRAYGFSAVVPKPYNLRQLGKTVGGLLAGVSPAVARRPS
jgi:hypothetical protein